MIHAHPITAKDGSQILGYQANPKKPITNMQWPVNEVEDLIQEIEKAAVEVGEILRELRRI